MLESEAFRNRANLQIPFDGFSGFLGGAQKVSKPGVRKKLSRHRRDYAPIICGVGAIHESPLQVRRNDKGEAQHHRWTFYETINFHQENLEKTEKTFSFQSSLLSGREDRMRGKNVPIQ